MSEQKPVCQLASGASISNIRKCCRLLCILVDADQSGSREETRPYYYSVDTWGIAAVLFHLLSGQPAWAGNTDDNGAVMLQTIFSTPIDWERLTLAGLSDLAVDFIERMLQIDPADRATDEEVLTHPWIRKIVSGMPADLEEDNISRRALNDDDEDLPDASQLEINDKHGPYGLDGTYESEHVDALDEEDEATGEHERVKRLNRAPQPPHKPLSNPRPRDAPTPHQKNNRLFGEIPESALQSSGVLGQNVNEALDIEDSQMGDYEDFEDDLNAENLAPRMHPSYLTWHANAAAAANAAVPVEEDDVEHSNIASVDDDFQGPDETSAESDSDIDYAADTSKNAAYGNHPQDLNALDAPSLYGTEDLVEDLNMASPKPSGPGSSAQASKTASPQSTASGNTSSARRSKRGNQHLESAVQDASFKRSKTDHQMSSERHLHKHTTKKIQPARNSRQLSNEQPEDDVQSPREGSSAEGVTQGDGEGAQSSSRKHNKKTEPPSFEQHEVATSVSHGYRIRDDPDELYLAIDKHQRWKETHPEQADHGRDALVKAMSAKRFTGPPPIDANTGPNLNTFVDPYVNLLPYDLGTPITLGVLTPTEGSIPTVAAITITNRTTTFGRDPAKNTFVHPGDPNTDNWERVGKNCIDLTFWYRNIEKEIDDKSLPSDWYKNENLICLISTRTSRYILINGVKLTKAKRAWNYGKLRTGDIITVVEPDPDREPNHESETKSLSFRCEFFTGASKDPRPADGSESFEVEFEIDEYDKNQDRIVKGFARKNRAETRERLIAEGRDVDTEQAEKAAKRRMLKQQAKEKAAEEEAGHIKRMRERGLLGPLDNPVEKGPPDPADSKNVRWRFKES